MSFGDVTPVTSTDYSAYTAAGGTLISEAEWPTYLMLANRVLEDLTFGRIATTTDTAILAKIADARFRVADAIKAESGAVASESLGSWSASYRPAPDAYSIARRALSGTGLTYTGLSVPAQGVTLDRWGEPIL